MRRIVVGYEITSIDDVLQHLNKIRSMSDEDLTALIESVYDSGYGDGCDDGYRRGYDEGWDDHSYANEKGV